MGYTPPEIESLYTRIRNGDRFALSKAITLVESKRNDHRQAAIELLALAGEAQTETIRIGITGSPGVGKSTLIEQLGSRLVADGKRIAILAIDPSSQLSKGSILGDKTRMEKLSNDPNAFIRPSAAGTSLGGVAQRTRETIALCEAAGYDLVIIETVGVGQSEYKASQMVDFFMLLIQPGGGDALQGIKRGIVEMADLIIVNKADGERTALAEKTRRQFRNAIHFQMPKPSGWTPRIQLASALEGKGIEEIRETIADFHQQVGIKKIVKIRQQQRVHWIEDYLAEWIREQIMQNPEIAATLSALEEQVRKDTLTVSEAISLVQEKIKSLIDGNT